MPLMSHDEWMSKTALFAKPRSKELKILDASLKEYGKTPGNQMLFDGVLAAYQGWAATKKNADASERNKRGAITDLYQQIIAFRNQHMPHRHRGEEFRPENLMAAIRRGAKLFGEGKLNPAVNVKVDTGKKDPRFAHVTYENMDDVVLQRAISCMADIQNFSAKANLAVGQLLSNQKERARFRRWFGEPVPSNISAVTRGLRHLHMTLQHKPQTYVLRQDIINHLPNGNYPFRPMTADPTGAGTYGYVWTHQAGSGYRVVLCSRFVTKPDRIEAAQTIYHELTHKVLKTVDHKYGRDDCAALATTSPTQAVENADNWGYYIISFSGQPQHQ